MLYIPIILGTARHERRSAHVAKAVLDFVKKLDVETELIDVKDFPQTYTQEPTDKIKEWFTKAERADGFIVVTPEYNHGYPGELKMFFDNVYKECNHKPIGFVGVSTGPLGGARGIEQLRLVSIEFQMVPLHNAAYFGMAINNIDEQGSIKNSEELDKKLTNLTNELLWYARVLKAGREA